MIDYCPDDPNQTLRCLVNTINTSVIAGFLLIFGSFQLYVYRKYSSHHRYVDRIGKSKLFYLQICLSLLVPAVTLVEFILESTVYDDGKVHGFMIAAVALTSFAYPFSTCLILTERYYRLHTRTARGHGMVLLVFWMLALIAENLSIIYVRHDEVETVFFVLRYLSVLSVFILGLKAPGIVTYNEEEEGRLINGDNESNGSNDTDIVPNIQQSALAEKCENRTAIVVPHRLSTLIQADEIIVLSEGVIVEKGRHNDLLNVLNGIYANLWSSQLQNLYEEQNKNEPFKIGSEGSEESLPVIPPALSPPPIPPPLPPPPIPPALPLSPLLPPPMPPPLPVTKKNVPKPGNPLKSFNWSKLSDTKLKGTVWSEMNDLKLYTDMDLTSIDTIFSAYQKSGIDNEGNTELFEKNRPKNISVIDGRRAQNCTILLSRLKLSDKEISQAILSMDLNDQLATDMVEQLLKFTPSAEEKLLLEEHSKNIDSLVRADRFLYEISQIPAYEQRMKSLLYKKQFATIVNDLLSRIASMKEASREVEGSKRLKKLLEAVLALGNYMNYGPRGNASGFHLASLNRLIDTKSSSVKGLTLLHYLVQFIEKKFEDLLILPEEISQVRLACKVSFVEIDKDRAMLRAGLAKVSDFTTKEFYEQATIKFEELENQFKEMKTRYDQAARRFGEDGSVMQPDEFFGIFNDFLTAFEEARQDNDNLKKLQEDGEKRAKQEAELKKCRRSVSESNHSKADSKGDEIDFHASGDLAKIKIQKPRRETRDGQNSSSQRRSLFGEESRERSNTTEIDFTNTMK